MMTPPVPEMTPEKSAPVPLVMSRSLVPRSTSPVPARLMIDVPPFVRPAMLNWPSAFTTLDCAMLPVAERASDANAPMDVAPV